MYLLTLFGCIFNLLTILFFGRFLSTTFLTRFSVFSLFISFLCSLLVFYEVIVLRVPTTLEFFSWIQVGFLNVSWGLLFDSLSVTLLCIVLFISCLVHLYSLDYMAGDPHLLRFIFSLSLFTFFMLLMITSNNVLQLFLGWEGVGLSSYLLINFWFGRLEANKSAIKAIVVNRIGDFGLYMALLFLVFGFKTLSFGSIFSFASLYSNIFFSVFGYDLNLLAVISSFVFLGTMGKSAQIGLHMWLPDAMEGPTPVSALLHAATMVTAGVFVLMRFSILVQYVPSLLIFIAFIGFCTTFFAGISAVLQYDIKKIIAYSTCSHLGIMLILCGFSHYDVAIFHLFNHAFFKALLFLSAGAVIHSLGDEQDIRKMGSMVVLMPFTYTMFLIGSLSLIGFPFLSGFFSKDRAWELFFTRFYDYNFYSFSLDFDYSFFLHKYSFFLFTLIVILSVLYAFRLILLVFPFYYNGYKSNLFAAREPSVFMWAPLFILSFFSVFAGYLFKDLFVGLGSNVWSLSLSRSFFLADLGFVPFQELFFSGILNGSHFFVKIFTFSLSMLTLIFLTKFFSPYVSPLLRLILRTPFLSLFYSSFSVFDSALKNSVFYAFVLFFCLLSLVPFWFFWLFIILLSLYNVVSTLYSRSFHKIVHSYINADHFIYRWLSAIFLYLSYHVTFKSIDRGFIEYFGPFGVFHSLNAWSSNLFFFASRPVFFSFVFQAVFFLFLIFAFFFFFNCVCFLKYALFVLIVYSFLFKSK